MSKQPTKHFKVVSCTHEADDKSSTHRVVRLECDDVGLAAFMDRCVLHAGWGTMSVQPIGDLAPSTRVPIWQPWLLVQVRVDVYGVSNEHVHESAPSDVSGGTSEGSN